MNANILKGQLREKGMTQAQAAKIAGISLSNFNAKINGTGGASLRIDEAAKIVAGLSLTPEQSYQIFFI